jgi:hypothetical protein
VSEHTPGPWRAGKTSDSVVADVPPQFAGCHKDAEAYYGGHLIAESVARHNRPLVIAAPMLLGAAERIVGSLEMVLDSRAVHPTTKKAMQSVIDELAPAIAEARKS